MMQESITYGRIMQGDKKKNERKFILHKNLLISINGYYLLMLKKEIKILDTHVGSGSSRICHDLGYEFVGYELSNIHFVNQEKRFKKLFTTIKN